MRVIIKKGDKFNKLTAVKFDHRNNHGSQHWIFQCDCGKEKVICVSDVKKNSIKSCGCLIEIHGMKGTRIYKSWDSMKQRCLNKEHKDYKSYSGRGITICPEWINSFIAFYKDMGERPQGKSLDRKNNDGNYCKENCKWSSQKQQCNNRRTNRLITYQGKTQTMKQWAEELGIKYNTFQSRLKLGWTIKRIMET